MGLNVTHGAYDGGYGSYLGWLKMLANICELPPLDLMEGYYESPMSNSSLLFSFSPFFSPYFDCKDFAEGGKLERIGKLDQQLPIKWSSLRKDPIIYLLEPVTEQKPYITYGKCGKIAKRLEKLLPKIPAPYCSLTEKFIEGCKLAYSLKQKLEFS